MTISPVTKQINPDSDSEIPLDEIIIGNIALRLALIANIILVTDTIFIN